MKRINALVTDSRIVFAGIPQCLDEPTNVLEFMGMYKSKYVTTRVYKHELEKVRNETVEAFENRFRGVVSQDGKLRREMRRYKELGCNPSLQVRISLVGFGNHESELVNCWTFSDRIVAMARAGRSVAFSFCNDAKGHEVRVEIPASLVKLLAKYKFSFRLVIGSGVGRGRLDSHSKLPQPKI